MTAFDCNIFFVFFFIGKAFDITYVRLKFHTSRPESFAIYKRTREDGPWVPYQYYSGSCEKTYHKPNRGFVKSWEDEQQAVCTDEFSDISPLTGGNVAFSTLEGRPSAYNFDNSPVLQVRKFGIGSKTKTDVFHFLISISSQNLVILFFPREPDPFHSFQSGPYIDYWHAYLIRGQPGDNIKRSLVAPTNSLSPHFCQLSWLRLGMRGERSYFLAIPPYKSFPKTYLTWLPKIIYCT